MSIRGEYSQKILSGEKLFEFRRVIPHKATRIYIYETAPTKWIVGSFEFDIIQDTPESLWENCGKTSGMDKKGFLEYYKGKELGFALKIKNLRKENINPYEAIKNFTPPQSYFYTDMI